MEEMDLHRCFDENNEDKDIYKWRLFFFLYFLILVTTTIRRDGLDGDGDADDGKCSRIHAVSFQ